MAIGDNIKRFRNEQKLTLEELAIYADVSKQTIQRYEKNLRKPQPETLLMIAKKLGVTCEELITGEPQNNPDRTEAVKHWEKPV